MYILLVLNNDTSNTQIHLFLIFHCTTTFQIVFFISVQFKAAEFVFSVIYHFFIYNNKSITKKKKVNRYKRNPTDNKNVKHIMINPSW
jgi:hypothetical protein